MDLSAIAETSGPTGSIGLADVSALQKALTAGYGTDVAGLSGGGALRIQSLDKTMQSTIQENTDFSLFNRLSKQKASATVDEWTEQNGIGGFLGGSTNAETGIINDASGSYNRRVGLVKFLMTRRQVSLVSTLQNNIADIEAVEYANGALQLCTDVEHLMFEGDSTVVPTEFDGITAQMYQGISTGQVDGNHIIDAAGQPILNIKPLNAAAATIRGYGNYGKATDIFMSLNTQADFDNNLDPAFRVSLTNVAAGGILIGAPVTGIRTSHGPIKTNDDVFIRDETQMTPFEVRYAAFAAAQLPIKPVSVVCSVPATDPASMFGALQAGNYVYLVTGVNANGQSTGTASMQVAIGAGQSTVLTITGNASALETGYVISRNRLNGGSVVVGGFDGVSDFREMHKIARTGPTTTFVDQNRMIPGTVKAFVLTMGTGASAIDWRQLMPMVKFPLYPTNAAVIPWAQLLFGYLRMTKRRQHAVIKNILPTNSVWRPFNV